MKCLLSVQASHPALEQLSVSAVHCDRRDRQHQLALHEAVRALQVTAVPAPQDRVEEPRLPRQISHSGVGPVRGQRPGETHHGDRVHRGPHPQRDRQPPGDGIRQPGQIFCHCYRLVILPL